MVKLQFENKKQYKITLPKQIIKAKGWEKGDEIAILLDEHGNIVLKKIEEHKKEVEHEGEKAHYIA